MSKGLKIFLKLFLGAFLVGALLIAALVIAGYFGFFGMDKDFDVNALDLNFTYVIYYVDDNGEAHELERI